MDINDLALLSQSSISVVLLLLKSSTAKYVLLRVKRESLMLQVLYVHGLKLLS